MTLLIKRDTSFIVGILFVLMSWVVLVRSEDSICRKYVPRHFKSAQDAIIRAWTALDLLRSMHIEPGHRMQFAKKILDDMLAVLLDVSALKNSCTYCRAYCMERQEDFLYLEELMAHLIEAFQVVFAPVQGGEERALNMVITKTAELVDEFKQYGVQSLLN